MTVQSLLDMTSGIDWQEKSYTPDETIMRMYQQSGPHRIRAEPADVDPPGAKFYYNSGNPYLLSALITRKTGQKRVRFRQEGAVRTARHHQAPMGPGRCPGRDRWRSRAFPVAARHGENRLSLPSQRHVGGKADHPVVVGRTGERGQGPGDLGFHYANLWWSLPEKGAYMALGRHSQMILVLPKLDIVAVMTGVLRDNEFYSIPGLIDDISRRSNPTRRCPPIPSPSLCWPPRSARPRRKSRPPVGGIPELAKAISGKTYQLEDNVLHVKNFTLNFLDSDSSWVITTNTGKADRPTDRFSRADGT